MRSVRQFGRFLDVGRCAAVVQPSMNNSRRILLHSSSTSINNAAVSVRSFSTISNRALFIQSTVTENRRRFRRSIRSLSASSSASSSTKSNNSNKDEPTKSLLVKAGLPFVLFSVLAAWVVSNALQGKLREMEASQGKVSKSIRQAKMEEEHEEMMERLNTIVAQDFDNTKRVKRPHEVLEERKRERERRNAWHRRWYRWIVGDGSDNKS